MSLVKYYLLLTLIAVTFHVSVGQVIINEFSCSNMSTVTDNYGEYEDWIELYNVGGAAVDITGYYLSDNSTNPTKWMFPSGTVPANGYLVVFASGRDEVAGGDIHTGFKLTQAKQEYIVFSNAAGVLQDSYWIEKTTKEDHSRGRQTDGAMYWGVFTTPTPGTANTNAMSEYATKPIFNIAPGYYAGLQNVSISSPDANVTIRYTTNGNAPTAGSTQYTGPIVVNSTQVIRAKAFSSDPNVPESFIESNTYFIGADSHSTMVLSASGDQVDNLLNGNQMEIVGAFELFNENGVLIDEATGDFNKHGNDSWAYDQRGFDYVCRDQYGVNDVIHHQIFRTKTRNKYQRLILKAAANDNYPFEDGAHIRDSYVHSLSQIGKLKIDERSHESIVVYINGDYWGVYDVREKVDDNDFTDYYYDQDRWNIQFLKTWGGTWSEYGGPQAQTDWNSIKNFILSNDMSIPANFTNVDTIYNWKSLVDYVVLNSYTVCSDWLNWNTAWWRGMDPSGDKKKWRYALWDMDATFGHYINYTGVPDTSPAADPCNADNLNDPGGQGHIPILNALMNNDTFRQYYISRYIDLSNTVFSCEFMQHHLDSLITIITPEMQRQVNRWGGTYAGWQANVQDLKDFIDDKCAEFNGGMIDCYALDGPYTVTFLVDPPLSGTMEINSVSFENFPYTGDYFGGIDILLDADENPGWMFDYWELNNHVVLPDIDSENVVLSLNQGDTVIAHFVQTTALWLGNDTTLCYGDSLVLDAGEPDSLTAYLWFNGSTDRYYTVTGPGNYSVTVTNFLGSDNDQITIDYLAPPDVDIGNDTTFCVGDFWVLDADNPDCSYLWQDATTGQTLSINSAGTYHVTVTNQCGSDIDTIVLNYDSPPVVDLGPDFTICEGDAFELSAGLPGMTYSWQDGSTNQFFNVTTPGTIYVYVDNGFSCIGYDEVNVTMFSSLDVNALGSTTICKGSSTIVSATGGSLYQWTPAESLDDATSQSPVANPDVSTTYTVIVSDITGCSYPASVTITVIPDIQLEVLADKDSVCPDDEVNITILVSGGTGGPYFLTDQENTIITSSETITVPHDTVYRVWAKDLCNVSVYDSAIVKTLIRPSFYFHADSVKGCVPLTAQFNEISYQENISYFWRFGDESISIEHLPEHKYSTPGTYDVSLTVTAENGCDSTVTNEGMIVADPVPVAKFYADPVTTTTVDPKVKFMNSSYGYSSVLWDFDDGTYSQLINPENEYPDTGNYLVQLTVETEDGCKDVETLMIKVNEENTFYVPTAFVPDGIGSNKYFGVFINGVSEEHFHMIIYDRWGEKVFETFKYGRFWDGKKKNGKTLPTGVYSWWVNYSSSNGMQHQESGAVTLIR